MVLFIPYLGFVAKHADVTLECLQSDIFLKHFENGGSDSSRERKDHSNIHTVDCLHVFLKTAVAAGEE